jgi:hypothetical protein
VTVPSGAAMNRLVAPLVFLLPALAFAGPTHDAIQGRWAMHLDEESQGMLKAADERLKADPDDAEAQMTVTMLGSMAQARLTIGAAEISMKIPDFEGGAPDKLVEDQKTYTVVSEDGPTIKITAVGKAAEGADGKAPPKKTLTLTLDGELLKAQPAGDDMVMVWARLKDEPAP